MEPPDLQPRFDAMRELLRDSTLLMKHRYTGETHKALLATNEVLSRLIDIVSDLAAELNAEHPRTGHSPQGVRRSEPLSPSLPASSPSRRGSADH